MADDFEVIPDAFGRHGTVVADLVEFLEPGDPLAVDGGALRTRLGHRLARTPGPDLVALRYRESGQVVIVYFDPPAYGVAGRYPGKLPAEPSKNASEQLGISPESVAALELVRGRWQELNEQMQELAATHPPNLEERVVKLGEERHALEEKLRELRTPQGMMGLLKTLHAFLFERADLPLAQ